MHFLGWALLVVGIAVVVFIIGALVERKNKF